MDLYDFEIETAPQKRSLCVDSIRMLYSGEIDEFVEKELLPDAAETMKLLRHFYTAGKSSCKQGGKNAG